MNEPHFNVIDFVHNDQQRSSLYTFQDKPFLISGRLHVNFNIFTVAAIFYSYVLTSWNIEAFSLCMFLTSTKLSEWSPMERRAPAQSSSQDQCT